jgi:hypothetical protein
MARPSLCSCWGFALFSCFAVVAFFAVLGAGASLPVALVCGLLAYPAGFCGFAVADLLWYCCSEQQIIPYIDDIEFAVIIGGELAQRAAGVPAGYGIDRVLARAAL